MMESLFQLTELESRFSLNMNVLSRGKVPNVLSLRDVLQRMARPPQGACWSAARSFRLAEIEQRLEVLGGYLIAYLNIDEVIRIIREEDEPKAVMMQRFTLTDMQAEAILNMRLRALAQARGDRDPQGVRRPDRRRRSRSKALLDSDERQWKSVACEIEEVARSSGRTPARQAPHRLRRRAGA